MEPVDRPVTLKSKRKRRAIRWSGVALSFLGLWLGLSWYIASTLTARRVPPFEEPAPVVDWGVLEPQRLKTEDGEEIGAWFHQGSADSPAVLLVHGNGGSRKNSLERARFFARMGCSVLLITVRAHGDSTGAYNDIGHGARLDVLAGVTFLESHLPRRPILVLGTSLGGAAALFAAETLADRVRGYIIESPYRDLRTAVWHRVDNALPNPFDWFIYGGLEIVAPLVLPHIDRISPVDAVAKVPAHIPILILGGGKDTRARPIEAEALRDRAQAPCELILFPEADHAQMHKTDPARYARVVEAFTKKAVEASERPASP